MNKTAIKKFAVESRQKLMKSTIERLEELGITDKEVVELVELGGVYSVKAQTLTETEKKNREIILSKIEEKGYEAFVEEVSYTWFNRIIAIRYMEVNDYLPFRTRVLSSEVPGKVDPDIVTEIADHIEELELNRDKVIELKEQNKQEELFKYVFIKACNYFGQFLPVMFEQIEDYTELLLPSVMISSGSVIKDMIELVPEEEWTNQVEIIGWLYQYYISEKKDQVFADLTKNKKITKENIPAATQLFTPEWIVKYMVENSLGRLWLEGHPNEDLKSKWKYYLEEAEQENSVKSELEKIKKESEVLTPEDLTIIDPAMGSGHILVYAFDVLYQIYQSSGYSEKEIPRLILEKNIYGLDIDDRAGQLAYFSLMMKARSYSRRFLRDVKTNPLELNICAIQESNIIDESYINYSFNHCPQLCRDVKFLVESFKDAKEYGALLSIKNMDYNNIIKKINDLESENIDLIKLSNYKCKILFLIKQAKIINKKYKVLCTNPPYMGSNSMGIKLKAYVEKYFSLSKNDLFTSFMEIGDEYISDNGYMAMINQQSWMFLSNFEQFRESIITNNYIINMIHLGTKAFEEINGDVVQSTAFIMRNRPLKSYRGTYINLTNFNDTLEKKNNYLTIIPGQHSLKYVTDIESILKISGKPLAYWLTDQLKNIFNYPNSIGDYFDTRKGMVTADNNRFIRFWYEVNNNKIGFFISSREEALNTNCKWFPYNKGGGYRKWFGNNEYIVNWENDGRELLNMKGNGYKVGSTNHNLDYIFKSAIEWTKISMSSFSPRLSPIGFLYDDASPFCYVENSDTQLLILGFLTSKVADYILKIINPTINTGPGNVAKLPIKLDVFKEKISLSLINENIGISQKEWNLFELSWGFESHPLIKFKAYKLEDSFKQLVNDMESQYLLLKRNEEMLNECFIKIYGLENELNPIVEEKEVSLRLGNREREMKSFISYAIGCMMGRYSLDEEGLVFAGGEFDNSKYQTFKADEDGIILISDTEYFEDDLLNRFVEFVKVVYGEETLEENLNFIADTECFKRKATESARDCLRRYFLKGFMEDHLKVYQKRPIYWMFDSGKQNGFKALIYMHRYNENMVAKVRTDYLHPVQRKYEAELARLDHLINFENISAAEKGKAKKLQEKLHKQLDECTQYDLLLAHVAHQRIPLDLDDGVKVNYQKFQNIELSAEGTSKAKKGDLLYKVKM